MQGIITTQERELLVAYQQYSEAGLQYTGGLGRFRKRVEDDALEALRAAMQFSLKRLLAVAVVDYDEDSRILTLRLPAEGRIGKTKIVDTPRYAVGEGPSALLVQNGQRSLIRDFSACFYDHRIQLDRSMQGEAPLWGDILPFKLDFSL